MSEKAYSLINVVINGLLFQLAWFAFVLNVYDGILGFLFVLLIFFHRLMVTSNLKREIVFIIVASLIGISSDAFLFFMEIYQPNIDKSYWLIPAWLVGLWCGFAMIMHGSLNWLIKMPTLFVVILTIAGPLSYILGSGLGAFHISHAHYYVIYIQWFFISIFMVFIYHYLNKKLS